LSLVELLGVVAIILTFTMVVMTSNNYATKSAEEVTYQQQLVQLQKALDGWIATKPTLNAAIADWNTHFTAGSASLVSGTWTDGPLSLMFVGGAQPKFMAAGDLLTSYAGQKLKRGFRVTWTDKAQDPKVEAVSLP